jgi:PilZ domain
MDFLSLKKSQNTEITERRNHLRLTAMGPVQLTVRGEDPQVAYLTGIGRGGLGLYLHREIKPKQLVVVTLKLIEDDPAGEGLKIAARVRWTNTVGRLHMAGLQFEPMSDQRYGLLLKHFKVMENLQL